MCLTLARAITAGPPYEWSPPHTGGLQLPTREAGRRPGHLFCVGRVGNNGREPRGQTSPQVRLQKSGNGSWPGLGVCSGPERGLEMRGAMSSQTRRGAAETHFHPGPPSKVNKDVASQGGRPPVC